MKRLHIDFTRELNSEEKRELLHKFEGCIFNLQEVIKNGFDTVIELGNVNCRDKVISYYSKFGCKFTDV